MAHSAKICRKGIVKPAKRGCSGKLSAVKSNLGFLANVMLSLISALAAMRVSYSDAILAGMMQ
jgi:hypothetical protein